MYKIGKSKTSIIRVENNKVFKTVKKHPSGFDLFSNEIKWLKRLSDFERVPTLVEYDKENQIIVTNYLGDILTRDTVPDDWELQVKYIVKTLRVYGCSHNDIKPREIVVKDKNLYLVDFGWATPLGEKLPDAFPKGLGGSKFRYGVLYFDDFYSFNKSIRHILRDKK